MTRNAIYDYAESVVNTTATPVYCASRFEPIPEEFPACFLYEIGKTDVETAVTLDFTEKVKFVTWEVQVFSNSVNDAVSEANGIMDRVEVAFRDMKFLETFCSEMTTGDPSVYRIVARFERTICDADTIPTQEG